MKKIITYIIRAYQATLSPDHGITSWFRRYPACRFHPTCSQYGIDAINHRGLIRGSALAVYRVLRCHPWNSGGYDPVPERDAQE